MIPVRPSKIVCVGRNYVAHAKELGNEVPTVPMLFFKPPSALIGPGEAIVLPETSRQVEYEAEIGVVIGSRLRGATEAEAEQGIGGYVCVNDVTCRDLQKTDGQWGRAKGYDTFCPVGPAVREGLDWRALEVIGRVNGEVRQRAPASDMHFNDPVPGVVHQRDHDARAGRPDRDRHAGRCRPAPRRRRRGGRDPRCRPALQPRPKRHQSMIEFSQRLRALPGYPLAEIPTIKRRLIQAGMDVIDLGAGDNDTPPPAMAVEAMTEALHDPAYSKYGFQQGLPAFRQAASRWIERRFGLHFDPDDRDCCR